MSTSSTTDTKAKVVDIKRPRKKSLDRLAASLTYKVNNRGKLPQKLVADWEPCAEERYAVKMMVAGGMKLEMIAQAIHPLGPISVSTLRRKFKRELKEGKSIITGKIVQVAAEMALSGKYPAMTMFWLKTQAGWRDRDPAINIGNRKFGTGATTTDDITKRLQATAKYMAETLPKQKTGTG